MSKKYLQEKRDLITERDLMTHNIITGCNYSETEIKSAFNLIQTAKKITLLTHYQPDADGISACAALAHAFEKMGKEIEAIYPTASEIDLKRQPRNKLINSHNQIPDLIITLDTANYARLYYPEIFKDIPFINIDHHISNSIKGTINLINAKASSTCEELFLIMKQWDKNMVDQYVAECLLFGILYDSQVFHTQSTTAQTLRIAADLVDYNVDLFDLQVDLLANKSPKAIALWGKILSNVSYSADGKAAWVSITQADLKSSGLGAPAVVGLSNFMAEISNVDISMVFYETESGKTKVSLRSKKADVNALAGKFGGGGHKNASGILVDKPIDQVVKEVTGLV